MLLPCIVIIIIHYSTEFAFIQFTKKHCSLNETFGVITVDFVTLRSFIFLLVFLKRYQVLTIPSLFR